MSEQLFLLAETETARQLAQRLFDDIDAQLRPLLPVEAEIRHIGATAIPGCLTKGDLDVVIRVPVADFPCADAVLASRFARNGGSVRTDSFSAFEDASQQPHLGLQLTVIGGNFDFFHQFAEALIQSPRLVEEYSALKRAHDNTDMEVYRAAKNAFIARVLSGAC
ncbi:GrpB family protein [Hyphomicrobium sp. D-2]|uniref:GrpB family protein n=1 Tax=Hyphomicrobium sp. D-2 TaxID=3041621 RepID=UPI0024552B71|nr:GrpB family protein [Hyphomicrobium sp. D-2]MDH4983872.1 GrpB family protein [Hyphomicrobium sp. D-2]